MAASIDGQHEAFAYTDGRVEVISAGFPGIYRLKFNAQVKALRLDNYGSNLVLVVTNAQGEALRYDLNKHVDADSFVQSAPMLFVSSLSLSGKTAALEPSSSRPMSVSSVTSSSSVASSPSPVLQQAVESKEFVVGEPVKRAHFSPDGDKFLAISQSGSRSWDVDGLSFFYPVHPSSSFCFNEQSAVQAINVPGFFEAMNEGRGVFHAGKQFAALIVDNRFKLLPFVGCFFNDSVNFSNYSQVVSMTFSPDGDFLALGFRDGLVCVINTSNNHVKELLYSRSTAQENRTFVAYDQSGERLLAASENGVVILLDAKTTEPLNANRLQFISLSCAALSPNAQIALVGSEYGRAALYNFEAGSSVELQSHGAPITVVAFSPDGRLCVTASVDGILVWDVATGCFITRLRGHTGVINHLEFSHDGKQLLSASQDGTVRDWNFALLYS
jgi:WD40 repeat protein